MSNFVVTGGAGFIGSNIVEELLKQGHRVKVIDNLSTGYEKNLDSMKEKVEFVQGDITDLELLKKEFAGFDYVLHQAALCSVPRSVNDPIKSNVSNTDGTLNVLVAARDSGIKRVVYASSSSVYGEAAAEYKVETLPISPLSPYALTKYAAERYTQLFYKIYGLETVCLRYFNVFGPKQDPNSEYSAVIPLFINLMLKGESPVILGDGEQSRDFTYVANNVQANILAATMKTGAGEVMNIACGASTTLNELVRLINVELGTDIKPIYKESRTGDIKHSKANIDKAKELIGYEPKINFEDGLKETIKWYKNQMI
jgi:nucleoside-diphosphate-sugar epimerase